jgi:nucleotide-binding universal stress UspA family protein
MGKCVVDMGDPQTVISEMSGALAADLIVVGSHARQGVQRLLQGSVAEDIVRAAEVGVLVVKNGQPGEQPAAR